MLKKKELKSLPDSDQAKPGRTSTLTVKEITYVFIMEVAVRMSQ